MLQLLLRGFTQTVVDHTVHIAGAALEKLHLVHLFGNSLLAYIFTVIAVICGSVVFSVCAKWFLNKVETFLKERVRRVNHV